MTKKEFLESDEPLTMIISLDPDSGNVLWDTYPPEQADFWKKDFEKDFPKMLHTQITNPAGIRHRKKVWFGVED